MGGRARAAAPTPPVIRLGSFALGHGKPFGTGVIAIAQALRLVEAETNNAAQVQYTYLDHSGPAVNEAVAAGQLDFAYYGGLPQIIGHAGGLQTRVIADGGVTNVYVAVRKNVKANTLADLKGLRIGVQRGTILHQALDRLIGEAGLGEKDIQLYDIPNTDQLAALTNGSIDASVGTYSLLELRDQGIVRIIYSTVGRATPDGIGAFSVTQDFADKYPGATAAVVRAYVKAAHWSADPKNREKVLDIWARSGTPRNVLAEDSTGSLKDAVTPIIDPLFVDGLKVGVDFTVRNKLIRQPFNVDEWIDRSYIDAALRDLKLVNFWPPRRVTASSEKP